MACGGCRWVGVMYGIKGGGGEADARAVGEERTGPGLEELLTCKQTTHLCSMPTTRS